MMFFLLLSGITTKNLLSSVHSMLDIVMDLNLSNGEGKDDPPMKHLEEFHLVGPFGSDVCSYIIKGAANLKNLALTIDWLDPPFSSAQPASDKDYLGIEYLVEIRKANDLKQLTELHLASRYRRGRSKLNKACAEFVLLKFPNLHHLGSFKFWNFYSKFERRTLIEAVERSNRNINFDEDLKSSRLDQPLDFKKRYVDNRRTLSCQDPRSTVSPTYNENNNGMLNDFFDVLAGLQGFFNGNGLDDMSDSDDSFFDEDYESDGDEDSDDNNGGEFDFLVDVH